MKPKAICIFEDAKAGDLLPLTFTRPVWDLRSGTMTLGERIRRHFPGSKIFYQCREYLAELVREQNPHSDVNTLIDEPCLFINARVIMDDTLCDQISAKPNGSWYCQDYNVAYWNSKSHEKAEISALLICYPWELVRNNLFLLEKDFQSPSLLGTVYEGVHLINRDKISIGEGTKIKPGVVLDAENGPIVIENNVTIMPNAVLEGPCFIGENSLIKIGAKIYQGTSIGPMCKVGGEVESSIIHGFSNKQHDGFLGHSYIGEWCNLGADSNTSDLKNNYGNVKVMINGREIDTGQMFVGLTMGDHSKSGINTMFNTGSVIGVSSNVFGSGFLAKSIRSFRWVEGSKISGYQIDKALEVARRVMARRKLTMTAAYAGMLKNVFDMTHDV